MRISFSGSFSWWMPRLFFALIGLVGINLIWLYPTVKNVQRSASRLTLEVADRARADINSYLGVALRQMENAGEDIGEEPDRREIILRRLLLRTEGLTEAALVDRSGDEIVRMDRASLTARKGTRTFARNSHFYLALEGAANIGDFSISSEGEPHAVLSVPATRDGIIGEVLTADINLRILLDAVRTPKIDQSLVYVLNEEGKVIAHTDARMIRSHVDFASRRIAGKVVRDGRIADGLSPEDTYVNPAGEKIFTVGIPIPVGRLGLFIDQPRTLAFAAERQVFAFAGATIVFGMLFFVILIINNMRLRRLNEKLHEFLVELDGTGKMLVRRDLELSRANARLIELDAIKSEFVSVAAHQLRTPLTGIKWTLSTLLEEGTVNFTSEQKKIAGDAFGATNHLVDLINDLLNVARLEEGRFGFNIRQQAIGPLVKKIFERFHPVAEEKKIAFTLDLPEELPLFMVDEEKMDIVIDNLIDNAVKYTPQGGRVGVRVAVIDKQAKISVSDTGIGIPKTQTHRMFSKFFRAQNAQLRQTSGTGLGLYVSKNIVEKHGGTLTFESKEGEATVFTITLPVLGK